MLGLLTLDELTAQVISMARDYTPRNSIELGVIQGFCVDVAGDLSPDLVPLLSSVNGLEQLVSSLESMPDLIRPAAPDRALWNFVRGEA
ncbi:hypothetical protein JZX87_22840 [Agrobacterium sp. Ap1]|jgi:hypothetical protein|uniref:hypothetical protein n=1 Tax=Rhizobium/Agrobacterium group TaxID=227290 RepID=UPI000F96D3A1|nr:hypothetical protein [Agrobacterium sp. Ap1]MBO0144000.1 hypothetical protein [Agrobacterium sp. Ap1]